MSNIWADTFSAIREPHFSEEKKDKEEKDGKKRWWDDDGDGKGYEPGEVEGKFSKKKTKKEETEYVDESQEARNNPEKYEAGQKKKYAPVRGERTPMPPRGNKSREDFEKWYAANVKKEERDLHSKTNKIEKLDARKGIKNIVNTKPTVSEELEVWVDELITEGYDLTDFTWEEVADIYESVQLNELDTATIRSAIKKGNERTDRKMDAGNVTGATKSMTNVDRSKRALAKRRDSVAGTPHFPAGPTSYKNEEVEELDEIMKHQQERDSIERRKKSRIYSPPTKGTHGEIERRKNQKPPSRLRSGSLPEEVEELDEADTYGMPARGDAERTTVDPMAAARAKAAKAKVTKEIADLQVAKQAQRTKVPTESVLSYVAGRSSLFEARFDPKKSKMRPASERTQRSMTDAQRTAAKKEQERLTQIHSKGETVLAGLRPQGKAGKVKTTPDAKPAAPAANRKLGKGKEDTLASAADTILKNLRNK